MSTYPPAAAATGNAAPDGSTEVATAGAEDEESDPRLADDHVRTVSTGGATVTLVGVVHGHPASVHRATTLAERRSPTVLALELPPLSVPLFEQYAADGQTPPRNGGEMSAAIQAAGADRVEGIDGPSIGFLRRLCAGAARERPSLGTVRNVIAGVRSAGREALASRAASLLAARTSLSVAVGRQVEHDVCRHDDPETQAADEHRQLERSRAAMVALATSHASRIRDHTREGHMAARLDELSREGDVVAVVGHGHLDPVARRLRDGGGG